MKVLQINATYGMGSTGTIVKDIGEMLEENGHQAYFAYQKTNEPVKNGYQIGNLIDWKYHALHARVFGKQAYASRLSTKKFLKWVSEIKPDVVHLHNLHSNYINLNMLLDYLAKNDIKTVITLHDCWYFTGKCSHYVMKGCNKWQNNCGNCPRNKEEVKSYFIDATSKVLQDKTKRLSSVKKLTIVGCSKWVAEEVKKSRIKCNDVQVIINGVDTSIFTPYGNKAKEFTVLGMGNKWSEPKNLPFAKELIEENKDYKFFILCLNQEQQNIFSGYDNVKTIGFVKDKKELAKIYSECSVFLNLTHADTLPTVNMESICSGTPVITFNVCGSPELLSEKTGYIVNEWDFTAVKEKLEQIKNEPLEYDVSIEQARFDKNENYKKYLEVYKSDN